MTLNDILTQVGLFFQKIFSVTAGSEGYATQIVNWVTATPIAMIGLYLYIVVALAGVARRFIPGV